MPERLLVVTKTRDLSLTRAYDRHGQGEWDFSTNQPSAREKK